MSTNRVEKVSKIMEQQKGSCSQAIFTTYGEYLSSGKLDYDTCMKIASGFGGGIAGAGNVCGALTGAIMALGLKYGGSMMEQDVTQASTKLLKEFTELHGSVLCRNLINYDLITDQDFKQAFEAGAFSKCPQYVEDVAEFMEKLI
jgi:C_GCAxxG_C_C family probable redox protein